MTVVLWGIGTLTVVGLIVLLITIINNRSDPKANTKSKNPLDVAKERYLKGEITKEELEEIARHLF